MKPQSFYSIAQRLRTQPKILSAYYLENEVLLKLKHNKMYVLAEQRMYNILYEIISEQIEKHTRNKMYETTKVF